MRRKTNLKATPWTGNVFKDLRFSTEESERLLVRADLLLQLQNALAARELTQAQAARLLHVTQPRLRDLLRGRIDLFSTDSLIDMLARLGVRVRLVLKPVRRRVASRRGSPSSRQSGELAMPKPSGSAARGKRAGANARRTTRKIDYSDIPEASREQLKAMRRVGRPPIGDEPRPLNR